jgi:hypothetical protein
MDDERKKKQRGQPFAHKLPSGRRTEFHIRMLAYSQTEGKRDIICKIKNHVKKTKRKNGFGEKMCMLAKLYVLHLPS